MLRIGSPRAVQTRVVLMVAIAGCGGSSGNGELAAETHETTTTQAKTTVVEPSITGSGPPIRLGIAPTAKIRTTPTNPSTTRTLRYRKSMARASNTRASDMPKGT